MRSDLIYDVGLFDGDDTAYYLFRGYHVVAIDANPLMIQRASTRFAPEIRQGRLTLLNVGVARTPGTLQFWVSDRAEWSSFDKEIASRNGVGHRAIDVPAQPFQEILRQHGVPHYLKIDIEGHDRLCVEALDEHDLPTFVSVESECVGDSATSTEEEGLAMLMLLREKGFERFKLVAQSSLGAVNSTSTSARIVRRMTSAARGPFLRSKGLSALADAAERVLDPGGASRVGFRFSVGSSGPWGDDIQGDWMSFDTAKRVYLDERREFLGRGRPLCSFWCDWHATK